MAFQETDEYIFPKGVNVEYSFDDGKTWVEIGEASSFSVNAHCIIKKESFIKRLFKNIFKKTKGE